MAMAQSTTDECKHCDGDIDEFYAPGYCSEACYYKYQADKALNDVRYRHDLCATCMTPIKDVEPPSDDWVEESKNRRQFALHNGAIFHNKHGQSVLDITRCPDEQRTQSESVIGYQYRKPQAETVIKELEGPDEYSRVLQTGTGCSCGQTDPSVSDNDIKDIYPAEILANYVKLFNYLHQIGEINYKLDKDVFFEAFKETRDWDYSLGRAME